MNDALDLISPGTLSLRLRATVEHAKRCGALQSLPSHHYWVEDRGIRFLVRQLEVLSRKPVASPGRGTVNPFLPPDPNLSVGDLSASHRGVLNKFNVAEDHLLLVTREFQPQDTPLTREDFEALAFCLGEYPGLGFYNSGPEAGASQPHRHLQYLSLPLAPEGPGLPIEPLLDGAAPPLPWAQARIGLNHRCWSAKRGGELHEAYLVLLEQLAWWRGARPKPYNLLVTREWMMLIPRRREKVGGISVNALGFAGALLVKDDEQLNQLKAITPAGLLLGVGYPAESAP